MHHFMKVFKVLSYTGLARSNAEAQRLVKQGAVSVGWCKPECGFFSIGECTCNGWKKVTDPTAEAEPEANIKVGRGFWRILPRIGEQGFDQLKGVAKIPSKVLEQFMNSNYSTRARAAADMSGATDVD